MTERPSLQVTPPQRAGMLLRLEEPTVGFYRYLYETIGRPWGWAGRSGIDDEELMGIIRDERVEIFVLYLGGVPAGFFELDRRVDNEVELAHYGLAPEFLGRGLGKYLLATAVDTAWDDDPDRVWASVTNLDHPKGLLTYQWAGFEAYETKREVIE